MFGGGFAPMLAVGPKPLPQTWSEHAHYLSQAPPPLPQHPESYLPLKKISHTSIHSCLITLFSFWPRTFRVIAPIDVCACVRVVATCCSVQGLPCVPGEHMDAEQRYVGLGDGGDVPALQRLGAGGRGPPAGLHHPIPAVSGAVLVTLSRR